MNTTSDRLVDQLAHFHCTEGYHKVSPMHRFVITDGVKHFAEAGGAYWVLDLIASYQIYPRVRKEAFQKWKIVSKDDAFVATGDDGNGNILATQKGEFTDLEEGEYQFYLTDNVLLLPSEY